MSPWMLLLPLALLALVAAFLRLKRALTVSSASAGIAMLVVALGLGVNSEPIYHFADRLLGGGNRAYLLVQVSLVVAAYFLKVAFVPGRRLAGRSGWLLSDTWVMFLFVAAIWSLFLTSDMPETAYRVSPYRSEPTVSAFIQLPVIYSLGCGILIFRQCIAFVRTPDLSRMGRAGSAVVALGLLLGGLDGILRLVTVQSLTSATGSPWFLIDGLLVIASALSVIVGSSLLFLRRRRPRILGALSS